MSYEDSCILIFFLVYDKMYFYRKIQYICKSYIEGYLFKYFMYQRRNRNNLKVYQEGKEK